MRFSRLDLQKYGHFDDCRLEFEARPIDLHVIFGRNEAGKSTAMSAITDLLFQFPSKTPYAFRHDTQLLRVGATLTRDGSTIVCKRKKGRINTLLDGADQPMDEGLLAAFLGGQTRDSFLRMFSLDHIRLQDGGKAILDAKDDIGQAIFAAGSGLISITKLQEKLDQEAKDIWTKTGRNQPYHVAAKEYEGAKDRQKKAMIKPVAWTQLRDQVTASKAELDVLKQQRKGFESKREKIELTRRTLGPIAALLAARTELEGLGAVTDLPSDAATTLNDALQEISLAEVQRSQESQRKQNYETERGKIVVEESLISMRAEIDALQGGKGAVDKDLVDLPKRRGEIQSTTVNLRRLQSELGWSIEGANETEPRLPKQIEVTEVRGLLEKRSGLDGVMSAAVRREEAAEAALNRAREDLEGLPAEFDTTSLAATLALAQSRGDLDTVVGAAERLVEREQKDLKKQLNHLAPWEGEVDTLEGLVFPSEASVTEVSTKLKRYADETTAERTELQKSVNKLAQIELQEKQIADEAGAISPAQLLEVRQTRDLTLKSIRDRVIDGAFKSEDANDLNVLSGQVANADEVADQRFTGATQSTRLALKIQERERIALDVDQHRAEVERLAAAEEAAEQEWRDSLSKLGFYLSPTELNLWRTKRDNALQAYRRVHDAEEELELSKENRSQTAKLLLAEIKRVKQDQDVTEATSYSLLLGIGLQLKQAAEAVAIERVRLDSVVTSALTESGLAATGKKSAQDGLTAWSELWAPAVKRIGLDPESSIAVIRAQLDFLEELRSQVKDSLLLEHRILGMETNVAKFKETVHALVRSCKIETQETDDIRLMQELVRRSNEAAKLIERKQQLHGLIEESSSAIEGYDRSIEQANAKIAPLLETAGVQDNDDLRKEIERCERACELTTTIRNRERELLEVGEGPPVEALLQAAHGAESSVLRDESNDLKDQSDTLTAQIEQKSADLGRLEVAFNAIDDGPSAAIAAAETELARSAVAEEAERYLHKRCQALLLSWAVERYRAEKQAPLLTRASALFAMLTLNGFSKLMVSTEDDEPRLSGVKADGDLVPVSGMSEGTVDQLFLALRIAAVEDEVAHGIRLPFLADDLFVNYDDERAAAGFKVLSELARHTQVLFFTHHHHLVSIAKSAVAPETITDCVLQS
jgi:uncharacterized protein YhaN